MRRKLWLFCGLLLGILSACSAVRAAIENRPGSQSHGTAVWEQWKEAEDWDITYLVQFRSTRRNQETGEYQVRVRYKTPNLVLAERKGYKPFTAVGDADSARIYFPDYRIMLWVPGEVGPELDPMMIFLAGNNGPLGHTQAANSIDLADAMEGKQGHGLLADEVVADRVCTALESRWVEERPGQSKEGQEKSRVELIDKDYGIPLAIRGNWQAVDWDCRALEARINQGVDANLFSLQVPEDVLTFRGRFHLIDAHTISYRLKYPGTAQALLCPLPEQTRPLRVMWPRYLPPTFLFLTSGSMGSHKDWSINVMFISPSGGTIEFKQGTSEYDGGERYPKRKEEARVEPTTVAGRPARFLRYEKPYSGVILAWEQEGIKYSLDGTDVSTDELVRMAESMESVTIEPGPKPVTPSLSPR